MEQILQNNKMLLISEHNTGNSVLYFISDSIFYKEVQPTGNWRQSNVQWHRYFLSLDFCVENIGQIYFILCKSGAEIHKFWHIVRVTLTLFNSECGSFK